MSGRGWGRVLAITGQVGAKFWVAMATGAQTMTALTTNWFPGVVETVAYTVSYDLAVHATYAAIYVEHFYGYARHSEPSSFITLNLQISPLDYGHDFLFQIINCTSYEAQSWYRLFIPTYKNRFESMNRYA